MTSFYSPSPYVIPPVYKQQLLTCILSVSPADEGLRGQNVLRTAQVIHPFVNITLQMFSSLYCSISLQIV